MSKNMSKTSLENEISSKANISKGRPKPLDVEAP